MPMARMATPTSVPQTFTRPGRMVVEPRNAPTRAGSKNSSPTLAWPICSRLASNTPAKPDSRPEATKAPMTWRRTEMPLSCAAFGLAPMTYSARPSGVNSVTSQSPRLTTNT